MLRIVTTFYCFIDAWIAFGNLYGNGSVDARMLAELLAKWIVDE